MSKFRKFRLGLRQSDDVTPLCSTGSQQGVYVADTVDAVDRCCANVERTERNLLQPRPALAALCFLRIDFLSARFPRRFLRANALRFSLSCSMCFLPRFLSPSSDVLGVVIPPHLDFSIVDTSAYSRVPSEHSSPPRFGSHVFRGGGVSTLLPQARLPRDTISLCWGASPPVDAIGRLALSASTSSRINRCHEGTLIHARTLWLGRRRFTPVELPKRPSLRQLILYP